MGATALRREHIAPALVPRLFQFRQVECLAAMLLDSLRQISIGQIVATLVLSHRVQPIELLRMVVLRVEFLGTVVTKPALRNALRVTPVAIGCRLTFNLM